MKPQPSTDQAIEWSNSLEPLDILTKIDGNSVLGLTSKEVDEILKEATSEVTISVRSLHGEALKEFTKLATKAGKGDLEKLYPELQNRPQDSLQLIRECQITFKSFADRRAVIEQAKASPEVLFFDRSDLEAPPAVAQLQLPNAVASSAEVSWAVKKQDQSFFCISRFD